MVFEIRNKVAIVTGGASGIGLRFVRQLLTKDIRGVVIADINADNGKKISEELKREFGSEKIVFAQTDVSNTKSFEDAFEMALKHFKNIDILINNAGVCLDSQWEKEVDINLKGPINGIILGMEKYLRNHKQGNEAVILNVSSASVLYSVPLFPIYVGTKHAIVGLTRCWGHPWHFERTKVRVVAVCPGLTNTPILDGFQTSCLSQAYLPLIEKVNVDFGHTMQSPEHLAKEAIHVLEKAPNGTVWAIENSQSPIEYTVLDHADKLSNNILH